MQVIIADSCVVIGGIALYAHISAGGKKEDSITGFLGIILLLLGLYLTFAK